VAAPRQLGDTPVHPIGLGCMPLSVAGRPDEEQAIRTIHAALGAGVNLLDTADAYSMGERDFGANERLVARALRELPEADRPLVATKAGHTRPGDRWELDGTPAYLRAACEASLKALEVDCIDLLQLHRPDPQMPFAESVGALRDLRAEGKIRHVGLSNVTVAQLEEAEAIVPVAAVQNELSLSYLEPLANGEVAACAARGIPMLAWSPLGGASADGTGVEAVGRVAEAHGVSPQRVVLAWLLSLSPTVLPIPGARRPETIRDSAAAAALELRPDEIAAIHAGAGTSGSVRGQD
jgi:aryl-alcohol dehydrogenase-like predicted oxidoreductase